MHVEFCSPIRGIRGIFSEGAKSFFLIFFPAWNTFFLVENPTQNKFRWFWEKKYSAHFVTFPLSIFNFPPSLLRFSFFSSPFSLFSLPLFSVGQQKFPSEKCQGALCSPAPPPRLLRQCSQLYIIITKLMGLFTLWIDIEKRTHSLTQYKCNRLSVCHTQPA